MIRVGVLGPTGYAGLHLIRILLRHPEVQIVYLGARRPERPHIAEIWPALRNCLDLRCSMQDEDPLPEMDAVFVALPHTVAMGCVPKLLDKGIKVIDISADYRLKDAQTYKKWYKVEHTDSGNISRAAYGLCELFRKDIAGAQLVANPGCYPTAVELGLAPLFKNRLVKSGARTIVDAKSGLSGAGRTPTQNLHFPEANESITAYKVGVHQHTGEIVQTLSGLSGETADLLFVPHLMPMDRGILATCYATLTNASETESLKQVYVDFYRGEPFVRVCTDDSIPTTKQVFDTNFCDIAVRAFGETVVVVSCIDNLIKGAAGQAVQNLNIMFGFPESLALI